MSDAAKVSHRQLGWRAPILQHFTPEIAAASRITIVADPDWVREYGQEAVTKILSGRYGLPGDRGRFGLYRYRQLYRSTKRTRS